MRARGRAENSGDGARLRVDRIAASPVQHHEEVVRPVRGAPPPGMSHADYVRYLKGEREKKIIPEHRSATPGPGLR